MRVRSLFEDLLSDSELGSELTFLASSELRTSELDTSELKTSEYRFLKIFILASYEQKLWFPKDIYSLINHYTDAKDIWDNLNSKFVNNMLPEWGRFVTAVKLNKGLRDSNYDQLVDKIEDRVTMHGVQVQLVMGELRIELGMLIQVKQGRLSATTTTIVYDEAGSAYDSDILSEVHDHDHYQDAICEHHEEHEMHDDDNVVPVVQSNVSSVSNDAYMMIFNDMHEPHAQSVSDITHNTVVDNSLTAKLATYKEQVELYKKRARFELTKREQKIDEQLRIVITDRNIKEENLKKELHSVKMQLASTINHNKSMVEEVMSLKKNFKQKENKYLKEFLDMKALKEKVAIGYKNPLCLTRAKQVQPALYNGYEIIKNNHVPALVHNTEDTLEIAEITLE
ncbi:hypothetical protein Tco_1214959 [Tanacetum coccineum]